ncbi:MAG TPA: hypothetical protein VM347_09300 [Nonomuraea sp.]|nr:hypothetical protein [Nonomuraea sp.]
MSESRFQLGLSAVLLAGAVWYAIEMASYPSNAGRVPLIVALVAIGVLVVQIIGQLRALRVPEHAKVAHVPQPSEFATHDHTLEEVEALAQDVEEATEGFDALLALDRLRRNRFIAISIFSVLYYVGALLIGFVLATGILITAFLLVARERVVTALVAGVISLAAVYGLVVLVLELPALDGYLF